MKALALITTVAVVGCSASASANLKAAADAAAERNLIAIGGFLDQSLVRQPKYVFVLNSDHTLTCVRLGYLLRRVARNMEQSGATSLVGVLARDSGEVFRFMRMEKVHLPTVLLPTYLGPRVASLTEPAIFLFHEKGEPSHQRLQRGIVEIDQWWDSVTLARRAQ